MYTFFLFVTECQNHFSYGSGGNVSGMENEDWNELQILDWVREEKEVWLACSLYHTLNCALCFLAASISISHADTCCCFKLSVFLLTWSLCHFSQASFKNTLFFKNLFPSKDPHCLILFTLHSLPAFSKVDSGKGKQETVFQKDKVALSCKQPVVRMWSDSPADQ